MRGGREVFFGVLVVIERPYTGGKFWTLANFPPLDAKYYVDFAGAAYCAGTLGHGVENWDCSGEVEGILGEGVMKRGDDCGDRVRGCWGYKEKIQAERHRHMAGQVKGL